MKVRAMKQGFYGGARRRVGDVFEAADGAKASWFEPAEAAEAAKPKPRAKATGGEPAEAAEAAKPKPKAKAKGGEPTTFSEIARTDSEAQTPKGADDLV